MNLPPKGTASSLFDYVDRYSDAGVGVKHDWLPPLPEEATLAAPGSPERIAVYRERLERGVHLHHPDDAVLKTPRQTSPLSFAPGEAIIGRQRLTFVVVNRHMAN